MIKNVILTKMFRIEKPKLEDLPSELLWIISKSLSGKDIDNMSMVCLWFNQCLSTMYNNHEYFMGDGKQLHISQKRAIIDGLDYILNVNDQRNINSLDYYLNINNKKVISTSNVFLKAREGFGKTRVALFIGRYLLSISYIDVCIVIVGSIKLFGIFLKEADKLGYVCEELRKPPELKDDKEDNIYITSNQILQRRVGPLDPKTTMYIFDEIHLNKQLNLAYNKKSNTKLYLSANNPIYNKNTSIFLNKFKVLNYYNEEPEIEVLDIHKRMYGKIDERFLKMLLKKQRNTIIFVDKVMNYKKYKSDNIRIYGGEGKTILKQYSKQKRGVFIFPMSIVEGISLDKSTCIVINNIHASGLRVKQMLSRVLRFGNKYKKFYVYMRNRLSIINIVKLNISCELLRDKNSKVIEYQPYQEILLIKVMSYLEQNKLKIYRLNLWELIFCFCVTFHSEDINLNIDYDQIRLTNKELLDITFIRASV